MFINDHKKSAKSLAGSCYTHELVLLQNVFIGMEGNARFDILEGRSAHHFVKLLSALIDAINSEGGMVKIGVGLLILNQDVGV